MLQQRSLSPPSVAGHPCRHSSMPCTPLETPSRRPRRLDISSPAPPLSKHTPAPPPHPLCNPAPTPFISRAGPRRLVSVFCDDPLLCNAGIVSRQHVPVTCIATSLVFSNALASRDMHCGTNCVPFRRCLTLTAVSPSIIRRSCRYVAGANWTRCAGARWIAAARFSGRKSVLSGVLCCALVWTLV
jgi:hypothetical protein